MKIRTGFVSNSSSSSFICILDDSNRNLANYVWKITEEEYVYSKDDLKRDKLYWDDNGNLAEMNYAEWLAESGYEYLGKSDFGSIIYSRKGNIYKTTDSGLGRNTSICFGEDLLEYINELDNFEYKAGTIEDLSNSLKKAIADYGLNNVLFLRESDEGSGGFLPIELQELTKQAFYEAEYH